MKKITFGILFSSLLLNMDTFAENDNIVIRKSMHAEASAEPTHWLKTELNEHVYCNSDWLSDLTLHHSYQHHHVYHEPPEYANPIYLENSYYPSSSDSTQYISTIGSFATKLYQPNIRCGWPHFFKERVILNANGRAPDQRSELGALFMESYASYFNASRGPRVEADVTLKNITNSNAYLSIMYLDENGNWKTAKTLNTGARNFHFQEYEISASLPFPTATALRVTSGCGIPTNAGGCRVEVTNIRMYSEECVLDQANIGQCL